MTLARAPKAALLVATLTAHSVAAHATNGMNLEGYGPIPLAMGGAAMAYDNGLGAMMNNPATLALAQPGNQLSIALHVLGPDVNTRMGANAASKGDSYAMPAIGWGRKEGAWTYGVGMFAQGGMGTDYLAGSPLALGTGEAVRSELGVGRVILPLAYQVSPELAVGGTLDLVWAGLDMKAAMPLDPLDPLAGVMRIDFSDRNDFTGKARGHGLAGKLGILYRLAPNLSLGLTYHAKSALSDMETGVAGATVSGVPFAGPGRIRIRDFEWPETTALGVAWQPTPRWLLAADVKRIGWADTMRDFKLSFTPVGGSEIPLTMPLDWDDQTVLAMGAQYQVDDRLHLRAGYNHGKNPVPATTLNPLFPAIVERHYTVGFDYRVGKADCIAAALSYAPEVTQAIAGTPFTVSHRQVSAMLGYNHRF